MYFYTGFLAYILGLGTTIAVMHIFKAAQPALLYLVPSCLGLPLFVALVRSDISDLFKYVTTDPPPLTLSLSLFWCAGIETILTRRKSTSQRMTDSNFPL